ncbi:molybdopterin-containing oxidoreductase family protein [Hydrogenimonas thermophila]|uniref:Thiosulfate reductase / polysulfide reductase chain A n=1 Tax=Hydrogenimonas thermophila TaxID=223786 RepID=A0A1I5NGN8_9BACT|nr:molybdopterin-dependent oxidoreductase [Hydrogenimonas thermophila]SFP20995.1 thiosulfate reductase / polysulfide reductase chain A [Hydrogenimonas thermophila]
MEVEISRRRFLQGTVALTVLGASGVSGSGLLKTSDARADSSKRKVVPTLCEMCVNKCAAYAVVENGIVKKLDPNPHFPKSKNMLCARGNAGIHALYDPDRLKYPMIRVGKKGEGKFKRVTWDEAYEAILNGTDKFKGLKQILEEEKDNRSTISYCAGEGMAEHTFKSFMADKFGSSNFVNHASICLQTTVSGYALTIGGYGLDDLENANYVIMAGANRAEAIITPDTMDIFKRTRGRGAKLVVIDPRYTNTAAQADRWVPIKVGTDLAFVLALTYVVMTETLYNKKFVEENVDGFEEYRNYIVNEKKYTPEWAEKITGVDAETIRTIAREFMAHAPRAIYYQGRRTAWSKQDFQLRRAQAIFTALGGGIDVKGGIVFGKKLPLGSHEINAPMYANAESRIDRKEAAIVGGSGTWIGFRNMIVEDRTPYPVRGMFIYKQNPMLSVPNTKKTRQMFEKMDLVVAIDTMPSDTVMMADVVLPECTYLEREDPVKSFGGIEPSIVLRQKAIDPMYDTKPVIEIIRGLAQKVSKPLFEISKKYDEDLQSELEDRPEEEVYNEDGWNLADAYLQSQEEINEHLVVSEYGKEAYETLKEKGVFYPNMDKYFKKISENEYEYYPEEARYYSVNALEKFDNSVYHDTCVDEKEIAALRRKFKTPSGKVQCNFKSLAKKGIDPMPTWHDEMYQETPEGKFKFITGRHAQFTQNSTANNIMLLDLMRENYLWINKEEAEKRGIKYGDLVEVESKIGKVRIKAYPTSKIIPGVLFYVHGFGSESTGMTFGYRNGASDNLIIEDVIEPVFGSAAMHETIVDVRKV